MFQKTKIEFINVKIAKPTYTTENGIVKQLLPSHAESKKLTYSCTVFVDVQEKNEVTCQLYESVPLIEIPCLVGCCACWWNNSSLARDMNAYFIIMGNRKVNICQLKMLTNKLFIYKKPNGFDAEVRSAHGDKIRSTSTLQICYENGSIFFKVPFLYKHKGTQLLKIPPSVLITLLHGKSFETFTSYEEFISLDSLHEETVKLLSSATLDYDSCLLFLSKHSKEATRTKREKYVFHILKNETLPHIKSSYQKIIYLILAVDKIVRVKNGEIEPDDRDSCEYRRFDMAGALVSVVFRQLFRAWLKSFSHMIFKQSKTRWKVRVNEIIISLLKKFSSSLRFHFSTGIWSISSSANNSGVIQLSENINNLSMLSQMTRCNKPVSKDGKSTKVRLIHPTEYGIC